MKFIRPLVALTLVLFSSRILAAVPSRFDAVHVYLVTIGPGAEVYEKFGHNMIRVVGPAAALGQDADVDIAFNWGEFSFDQPNFIWHFIQGRMLYFSGAHYFTDELAQYKADDRSMWQQELNLSPDEKARLWQILLVATDPDHRNYRYDYYRDNCSTRTRDALDEALNGQIRAQLENIPTDTTLRWHTRRLMQSNFWLYTGLQYILGHPVDQKINAWQECFLPVQMMGWMNHITVTRDEVKPTPLVLSQSQLYQSKQFIDPTSPPHWMWIYVLIGIGLAVNLLRPCLGPMRWWIKIPWIILAMAWCALGGAAGSILVWGTFYTDHIVIYRNENIFQLTPIMALLILLIPLAAWRKGWLLKIAIILAGTQAFLNILGLLLKIFSTFNQPNHEIIALALPANIALAIGLAAMRPRIQSVPDGQ